MCSQTSDFWEVQTEIGLHASIVRRRSVKLLNKQCAARETHQGFQADSLLEPPAPLSQPLLRHPLV